MGIQVQDDEMEEFQRFLDELGMKYWAENDNPAYRMFLG